MTTTPEARIAEALAPHSWHVRTNEDGSLHGVCLGCFENGVLPEFHTWREFAKHLTAVIAGLPDIAVVTLPSADQARLHPIYVTPRNDGVPPIRYTPIYRQSHMSPESARVFAAELLAAARAAGGES